MNSDEKTERMPTADEEKLIRSRIDAAQHAQRPRIGPAWISAVRLPTAEESADKETFAAMLDVMRRA